MIKKTLLLLTFLCACLAAKTQAQNTMSLTLAEAQRYAEEHNYTLQNASLDIQNAEATRWQTIATMLPQISAKFDYSNMLGYELKLSGMSIPMNPNGTLTLQAAIALTGAQIVGTKLNEIAIDMANISQKKSRLTIRTDVKSIYTSILVMEETVSLLDSSMANMERLLKTTQDAVNVGAAEQISADKLSVQVASMRNSVLSTRRSLQLLYNSLLLQLGADVNTQLKLTTKLDELLNTDKLASMKNTPFDMENNYDYQLLKKNEELSKRQVTLAKMNHTPTVSAYYQYTSKTYFGKAEGMNMTPPNVIGISISQPIFQSGAIASKIKSAKINYQETLNSKRQAEDGLQLLYNQAVFDLASALDSYATQKENLNVTHRVFDNTLEKYKYGHATNIEVTNASTDIITAQSNYIQSVLSVVNAQVTLENILCRE